MNKSEELIIVTVSLTISFAFLLMVETHPVVTLVVLNVVCLLALILYNIKIKIDKMAWKIPKPSRKKSEN